MSTALPALTRSYFTRANIPYGVNSASQNLIESFGMWMTASCLLDHTSSGSTGGVRDPASIWICRGSGDASTGSAVTSQGVVGTNRWNTSGSFPGAFTRGNNSTNHHWMLLENVSLGLELLLNHSTNAGYECFSVAKSGTFSGGTVSACPAPTPTSASVQAGQITYSATDGGQTPTFWGDSTVIGGTNYFHFVIAPTGEFFILTSRVSTNYFRSFVGVWKSTGQQVGDANNFFVLHSADYTDSKGAPAPHTNSNFCASIQPSGTQRTGGTGSIIIPKDASGVNLLITRGVDAISGQYKTFPSIILETSPGYYERGSLPDLYLVGTALVGGSIPNAGAQLRTVAGSLVIPFTAVPPLL